MPRPKGWKPLSYRTIAEICAALVRGGQITETAAKFSVHKPTVSHLKNVLVVAGVVHRDPFNAPLSSALESEIRRLIQTTKLTNHQIRRIVGLSSSGPVRTRRDKYHEDLRTSGQLVPRCKCGEDFQHVHRCRFMRCGPKPIEPSEHDEAVAELVAGVGQLDLKRHFSISAKAVLGLLDELSPKQREKRENAIRQRRAATYRRNRCGSRCDGLYERLDAKVPHDLPQDVRAETIQCMALAILDGKLAEKDALKSVRRFSAQAFNEATDRWKTVSIDEDHDGWSLGDMIEDESALEEFSRLDDLELAERW